MGDIIPARLLIACHRAVRLAPPTNTRRPDSALAEWYAHNIVSHTAQSDLEQLMTELRRVQNLIHAPYEGCADPAR